MKDISSFLLRITFGLLMLINHGIPKLSKLNDVILIFPDPLGISNEWSLYLTLFAEVLMAAFVAIGLFSRVASIPLTITMIIATFVVHQGDSLAQREMAILYLIAFLTIGFLGSGKYSVDYLLKKRR
jgi:putative oxidoreductase